MILLDTNVLGRLTHPDDPQCAAAAGRCIPCSRAAYRLVIVPQNLYEFWAIATRRPGPPPGGSNGLGMTPVQAGQWARFFRRRFTLLPDAPDLPQRRLELVDAHGVLGFRSHDARLVAAMQIHQIPQLLTFNAADFRKFPISVLDPASV